MKISIAMCTYNGARFLGEQLESIAGQTRLPDELVVCDDGSTDETIEILERFALHAGFPVRIQKNEKNLGICANFLQAIGKCEGQLIALADQDDIWLKDKLANAERKLLETGKPESSLYFSRLQYVDSEGRPLALSAQPGHRDFGNAIVENAATGCSVMFGSEIRQRILLANASDMQMHDWWAYLVATAFGQVVYDETPGILYRQHSKNSAGWLPRPQKIKARVRSLLARVRSGGIGMDSLNQASLFAAVYPELATEHRKKIDELLKLRKSGFGKRLAYAIRPAVYRNDFIENIGLRIILLLGWH